MNPLGTRATSFRVPTKEDLSHDFLWRIHKQTPAAGTVQIFNRSHYEDILVPSVERTIDNNIIKKRYDQINDFEKMLEDNGTTVVKFFLNISKTKQKEKLNERLTDPTKYWKHNTGDWDTRDNYDEYIDVYEKIFEKCNDPKWHVIAADQNWYKIYQICKVLIKVFEEMELRWPKLSPDQETAYLKAKADLAEQRDAKVLAKEKAKEDKKAAKEKAKEEKKKKKKLEKAKKKAAKKTAEQKAKAAKKAKKLAEKKSKKDKKIAKKTAKMNKKKDKKSSKKKNSTPKATPTVVKKSPTKAITPSKTTPIIKKTTAPKKTTAKKVAPVRNATTKKTSISQKTQTAVKVNPTTPVIKA